MSLDAEDLRKYPELSPLPRSEWPAYRQWRDEKSAMGDVVPFRKREEPPPPRTPAPAQPLPGKAAVEHTNCAASLREALAKIDRHIWKIAKGNAPAIEKLLRDDREQVLKLIDLDRRLSQLERQSGLHGRRATTH